ncbi:hypothetical protein EYB26_005520 [Talaromyces marneffei]|uniref:Uncharacterized protein n=1 Tax=Talaromyces marneffei (strain ATCC 18224 / CBS 334.59 / QM 7333) TaxID=441960 RepID=B6Q8H6_TALMQ|nr:uncharacterized protein EYB26_005520 [Talaromyces marneffei]EEA25780.1 hypothetical protein PMAA_068740 [Talaromyces marneffei ATCC 18224]QGA17844.1 hypothetical protein EYB26_005520 [Talaromyces marneffei]
MPPKKSVENNTGPVDANKPDEAALQFAFECLRAVGNDGVLDMSALSQAMGHTNVMSTRNAFARHKKRWGFGNINTKTTVGSATPTDEAVDSGTFPPLFTFRNDANKVAKKRGRPSASSSPSKKEAAAVDTMLL